MRNTALWLTLAPPSPDSGRIMLTTFWTQTPRCYSVGHNIIWCNVLISSLNSGNILPIILSRFCCIYLEIWDNYFWKTVPALQHIQIYVQTTKSWRRHQMELFYALQALCAGNSPLTGEFPAQRPVTRNFDVFFDLYVNKRLSKQSWGWWFETSSCLLWRHSNDIRHPWPAVYIVQCMACYHPIT